MGTANNKKLRVSIDESYKNDISTMVYKPNVAGTIEFFSEYGVFVINSLKF